MKKILIALAIFASAQLADAQVKAVADAQKAIDAAQAAASNAKKATKAATWANLGKAYVAAHEAPAGALWTGASKQELALMLGNEKPSSTSEVVLGGEQYTKEVYNGKNLYFRPNGLLGIIEVTKTSVDDPLGKALEAYAKAASIDPNAKGLAEAIEGINEKYINDAYTQYQLGNYAEGSKLFAKAAKASKTAPVNKIDSMSVYNTGFLAQLAGDKEGAKAAFLECLQMGYYSTDGELFAKLADLDPDNTKKYLEEGFQKFPSSQSILIGLINYYMAAGEGTDRLFELLDAAKKNEPNNASLFYVEGNIRTQLGEYDKAVEAYEYCAKVNPNYEFGYIGEGTMYYNRAVDLQDKAQAELDDAKYMKLAAEFEEALKNCIDPFEKAYNITKDPQVKVGVAEYLKNATYRFREQDAKYQAAYDKYSEVVSTGEAK